MATASAEIRVTPEIAAERCGIHGRRLAGHSLCFNFPAHSLEPCDHPVVYCDLRRVRLGRLRELCGGKRDGFGSIFGLGSLVDYFEWLRRASSVAITPDLDALGEQDIGIDDTRFWVDRGRQHGSAMVTASRLTCRCSPRPLPRVSG